MNILKTEQHTQGYFSFLFAFYAIKQNNFMKAEHLLRSLQRLHFVERFDIYIYIYILNCEPILIYTWPWTSFFISPLSWKGVMFTLMRMWKEKYIHQLSLKFHKNTKFLLTVHEQVSLLAHVQEKVPWIRSFIISPYSWKGVHAWTSFIILWAHFIYKPILAFS